MTLDALGWRDFLDRPQARHQLLERRRRRVDAGLLGLVVRPSERCSLHALDARELLPQLVALPLHAVELGAGVGEREHRFLASLPERLETGLLLGEARFGGLVTGGDGLESLLEARLHLLDSAEIGR